MIKYYVLAIAAFVIDQVVKMWAVNNLTNDIVIIEDFFRLSYVENYGISFSMLSGNKLIILIFSLVGIYLIWILMTKHAYHKYYLIPLSLMLAGAVGNLFDRIFRGYVVDYFQFTISGNDLAVFNIADTFLVVGMAVLILVIAIEEIKGNGNNNNRKWYW